MTAAFRLKKSPFSNSNFSPQNGQFDLSPLESLNLLLSGYTPCIRETDQPLAQKSRLKWTIPKGDFFHISGQLMFQK
jgi:hypothetical protein